MNSLTKQEGFNASELVCGADNYDSKDSAICIYNTRTKMIVYCETIRDKEEFAARMKEVSDNGIKIIREGQ